jgi:glycosyltransferase involved in cell wall biosynthesis
MKLNPKRICLISVEIFAWGKYGGYGKSTRIIGRELVKRGYEVFALIPRRQQQQKEEVLDGITVLGYSPRDILSLGALCKKLNADIYHSCEPSIVTWLAMKAQPKAIHLVTCQDPKGFNEWIQEFRYPSKSKLQVVQNYIFEANYLVRKAVQKAHAVYVPAKFQCGKAQSLYRLKSPAGFLPTPTEIPEEVTKGDTPVVLYMGRLDHRKRPEITLNLATSHPGILFKIAGMARDPDYEKQLKATYGHLPNVAFLGFVKQFQGEAHHQLFCEAWIYINSSVREGLPNSFIEAAGHQCAILSHVDPDHFASSFGRQVDVDGFSEGLDWLLEDQRWRKQGSSGYAYVRDTYSVDVAMDAHEREYQKAWIEIQK